MRARARILLFCCLVLASGLGANECNSDRPWSSPHEAVGRDLFTSPQVNPLALSPDGSRLYVANTTSNTISIIDTASLTHADDDIKVGIDPVAIAVRPDGNEVWIANHISDSINVLDTNPASPTYQQVVASIQDLNAAGATLTDEPVGVAFADNTKAYVAISSRNRIAVIDVASRTLTKNVDITAQDPRAIAVRNGRLYVAAFESTNQTELSICPGQPINPPQCTLDQQDIVDFATASPNLPGADTRIVVDMDAPDRDLFVFSTADESPIDVVNHVGTLLYGLAVDSNDHVFVTNAEARNEVNGEDGQNLITMQNRMFLNQISLVDCNGASCSHDPLSDRIDLDPPVGTPPTGQELATPYGIAISDDDSTLVVTAAGTSRVFTVDTATGNVLDVLDLGSGTAFGHQIPRGVALRCDGGGAPQTAYVLNTLENTVAVVDVSNPSALALVKKLKVGNDPTPDEVRRGRIAFNNAFGSDSNTFSCGSCHPDGNTDQLLWRIGGACTTDLDPACGDDEIRSTMPVRGLKNTLPLHWDGTLGDPFGGGDGSVGATGSNPPDCTLGDADGDHDCFRHLVDASLAGVMCDQDPSCAVGPSGLPGRLTVEAREDMAHFLASVAYPPARSRPLTDVVTASGIDGFSDFFVDRPAGVFGGDAGDAAGVTTCADMDSGCHALPLGADHDSATLAGFDAPTMRGMTDRFLQFSIGITNAEESLAFANDPGTITLLGFNFNYPASPFPWDPANGFDERVTFAAAFPLFNPVYGVDPNAIFKMFEQASTGTSGAVGRQVTLKGVSTDWTLLDGLEAADARDVVNLQGDGVRVGTPVTVSYLAGSDLYQVGSEQLTRAELESEVDSGDLMATLTAYLPANHGSSPMPLLSVVNLGDGPTGNPDLPVLPGDNPMTLVGIDVHQDAQLLVDGAVVSGTLSCSAGSFTPFCDSQTVVLELDSVPSPDGLHLLQVQNPLGPLSEELPICVGAVASCQ